MEKPPLPPHAQYLTDEELSREGKIAVRGEDIPINYQGKGGKVFTEEEDRVLLCLVNQFGYGAWDRIKQEICSMEMFALDYYLRSRTAAEIGRRCDSLMRICDNADLEYREKKERDVRHVLQEQRAKTDRQVRPDVKQHQARVGELIMKEAKRMLIQREAARAKRSVRSAIITKQLWTRTQRALVSFLFPRESISSYPCREGHARLLCKD
ncbi:unnamed protein product [Phytophthora lilii]|uniref:Unnamed protein product n=1 Tax=Phytophthora lilii TaxID=2077276 RepID=A0A9W6X062_9STRA|nr:unnamed protein product [Phytophthora lilii]